MASEKKGNDAKLIRLIGKIIGRKNFDFHTYAIAPQIESNIERYDKKQKENDEK